jgi:hypothetical protein
MLTLTQMRVISNLKEEMSPTQWVSPAARL